MKINIYYQQDNIQFDMLRHLNQPYLPLELITQMENFGKFSSNIVTNGKIENLVDGPIIVPIDYQSVPMSYESRDGLDALTPLGTAITEFVESLNTVFTPKHDVTVLIYTSTEPYFNDSLCFIKQLAVNNPFIKFVISGCGETGVKFKHHRREVEKLSNVSMVYKQWYFDRVHYNKFYSGEGDQKHFRHLEDTPPADLPKYITCENIFLLTMRNPRAHRLLMSAFVEQQPDGIGPFRYSRAWSLQPWDLSYNYHHSEINKDFLYYIELISTAIQDLVHDDVPADDIKGLMKTLYSPPHKLDMPDISDVGHPPKWLYDGIVLAVIPTGEHSGYGYADEKQIIPMVYKKPFICFGGKGVNEELKKLGFDPYTDIVDQSYNNHDKLYDRVKGCFDVLKNIEKLSAHELHQTFVVKCEKSINHNYNHFISGSFRINSNNNFFKEVLNASS